MKTLDISTTTQPPPLQSAPSIAFSNTKFDFLRNIPSITDVQEPASDEIVHTSSEIFLTHKTPLISQEPPKNEFVNIKVSKYPKIILRATYAQYLTNALGGLKANLDNASGSSYLFDFRKKIDAINRLSAQGSIEEPFRYFANAVNLYLVEKHWSEFTVSDIEIVQAAIKEIASKDNLKILHVNKILRRIRKKGLNIHSFLSGIDWESDDGESTSSQNLD